MEVPLTGGWGEGVKMGVRGGGVGKYTGSR